MTKLSVNVNKLATLRNSRGKNNPDVLKTSLDIIAYGAQGITVHPRPDGRHIRREDVYQLAKQVTVEFNIEGYPDQNFLELINEVKPTQCTLVPDPPGVLTSNAGWKLAENEKFLQQIIAQLHDMGVRTALFIDPFDFTQQDLASLAVIATDRVELYTEAYAENYGTTAGIETLAVYQQAAYAISALGVDLNAGHDLNLINLKHFVTAIPNIKEVSIGHALICDALYIGLKETVARYLQCLA